MDEVTETPSLQIATNGGAYIGGDVSALEFVGRDKIIGYTVEEVAVLMKLLLEDFQPRPFDGHCPYIGLRAFDVQDAAYFFGRNRLIEDLLARVNASHFIIVTGPSGSGKSSLVRAGLIQALKQDKLPGSARWLYETLKPGRDPMVELARAVSSLVGKTAAGDELLTKGKEDPTLLHRWVEIALGDDLSRRVILLIDQLEEIFTQSVSLEERVTFLKLITSAAIAERGRTILLFTLRSDFIAACAAYPFLNALLNQQFMQVGPMQLDELVQAIAMPALHVGLHIDNNLVTQIVNDMQGEPGALPLMQFALTDLFYAQQSKGGIVALNLSDYLSRGGLHKALERHADAELGKLLPADQQLAREIFKNLIRIGQGTQDTRRTAILSELTPANADELKVKAVVQKLVDARLLTTDEQNEQQTVTIAHEKLIEAWSWLRLLGNEHRASIALQNQINEDAQNWYAHNKDTSYLYQGTRLTTILKQIDESKPTLSKAASEFIQASKTYKALQMRPFLLGIIALLLIPAIFLGSIIWMFFRRQYSDWQLTSFPSVAVKTIAINEAASESTTPKICIGTTDIGIGCSPDGKEWNIYQVGFPTADSYILNDRNTWWGNLTGSTWETNLYAIETLNFDSANPLRIAALVQDTGIFYSEDGGNHWQKTTASTEVSPSLPLTQVHKLTFYNNQMQLLLNKGVYSPLPENLRGALLASSDSGISWNVVGGPSTVTGQIRDIYLDADKANQPQLYVAGAKGLFRSKLDERWEWQQSVNIQDEGEMWLIAHSNQLYYLATLDSTQKHGKIYRWYPSSNSAVELWLTYQGVLKELAADPDSESNYPLWLLFEDNHIVSICKNGHLIDRGNRPGWFWNTAHDIKILHRPAEDFYILIGHSEGLLQYRFPDNASAECD